MKPTVLSHPAEPADRITACTVFRASTRRRATLLRPLPPQCGECGRFNGEHLYEPVTELDVRPLFFVRQHDRATDGWWWIGVARHILRRPAGTVQVFSAGPFPRQRSTR